MLLDAGMVQMYSKSANVNAMGLRIQAGPPLCMDRPPCSYGFSPGGLLCPSETHCIIPTSAPVFVGNIFTHPYTLDS